MAYLYVRKNGRIEIREALKEPVGTIIECVIRALEQAEPELAAPSYPIRWLRVQQRKFPLNYEHLMTYRCPHR